MASRLPVGRQSAETRFGLVCSLGHAYSVLIITHWVLRAPKKVTAHVIRSVVFVAVCKPYVRGGLVWAKTHWAA